MNALDECANYLACQPEPTSTYRGVLPPDVAPKVNELAATGSPYPLVLVTIGVVVIILAVVLIWIGRRSR